MKEINFTEAESAAAPAPVESATRGRQPELPGITESKAKAAKSIRMFIDPDSKDYVPEGSADEDAWLRTQYVGEGADVETKITVAKAARRRIRDARDAFASYEPKGADDPQWLKLKADLVAANRDAGQFKYESAQLRKTLTKMAPPGSYLRSLLDDVEASKAKVAAKTDEARMKALREAGNANLAVIGRRERIKRDGLLTAREAELLVGFGAIPKENVPSDLLRKMAQDDLNEALKGF
jgi:hypothetical protein